MLARTFHLLAVLLCVVALAGCEGDEGPTGPAGPPGPSVIVCYGEIDGYENPADVVNSWPSDVIVSVADIATGIWDVTLTGTFTSTEGTILTTITDNYASRTITSYITSWSTTVITFRVGIWNTYDSVFTDGEFSFVLLAE